MPHSFPICCTEIGRANWAEVLCGRREPAVVDFRMRMGTEVAVERRTVYLDSSGWADTADYCVLDSADIADTAGIAFPSCRWAPGKSGSCSTDFAVDCGSDCRIRYSDRLVVHD